MRTLHQTLHLQHRKHTGKLLHHQHTSYRGLTVILALSGCLMFGLSALNRAAADTFGVAATVAVPAPSTPPIITSPTNGTKLSGSSVLITGSCPLVSPQAIISISVDDTAAGTSSCDVNNDFSTPIALNNGTHSITATALSITGGQGRTTTPVTISVNNGTTTGNISIETSQPYIYASANAITWRGVIKAAGSANIFVHVDWGDNTQSNYTVSTGTQDFTHNYSTYGSHNVLLTASTSAGQVASEQFASAALTNYTMPVSGSAKPTSYAANTVVGLYGIYVTIVATTTIVWVEAKHAQRHERQHHIYAA